MTRRRAVATLLLAACLTPVLAAQRGAQPLAMPDAIVNDLLELARNNPSSTFSGLVRPVGKSTAFSVTSNRAAIAFMSASTREKGGRYTPPASARQDLIVVECGDSDPGEIFECDTVAVATPDGVSMPPVLLTSGPRVSRNAAGAEWTVRRTTATFRMAPLRGGFTVTAYSPDGTEWPLVVSAEDALMKLMIGSGLPSEQLAAFGGPPPARLTVDIRPYGDGWRIANQDVKYSWRTCAAFVGPSTARLPALEPNGAVIVNRSEFRPALQRTAVAPTITCRIGSTTYLSSGEKQTP